MISQITEKIHRKNWLIMRPSTTKNIWHWTHDKSNSLCAVAYSKYTICNMSYTRLYMRHVVVFSRKMVVLQVSSITAYNRGGQTFSISGQIWKLFFITGHIIQNYRYESYNFWEAEKNLFFLMLNEMKNVQFWTNLLLIDHIMLFSQITKRGPKISWRVALWPRLARGSRVLINKRAKERNKSATRLNSVRKKEKNKFENKRVSLKACFLKCFFFERDNFQISIFFCKESRKYVFSEDILSFFDHVFKMSNS